MPQNNIRSLLSQHPLIPVVTFQSLEEVDPVIERLKQKGIHCIEITLRTACAVDAMKKVKYDYGSTMAVGMGTITNHEHIQQAMDIGIDFMVCPGLGIHLMDSFEKSGIGFLPGVATPSEIIAGMDRGWNTFKFFPAHLFGGLEALKTYGQVFPDLKFCPTGGITEASYSQYTGLPNVISVGGSWMTK